MISKIYGVIDIGSNSVRALVHSDGKILYRDLITSRLGEGLALTGKISLAAAERTKKAIKELYLRCAKAGAEEIFVHFRILLSRQHPHADLGVVVDEADPHRVIIKIAHVNKASVLTVSGYRRDFIVINPQAALFQTPAFSLLQGYDSANLKHPFLLFPRQLRQVLLSFCGIRKVCSIHSLK